MDGLVYNCSPDVAAASISPKDLQAASPAALGSCTEN